MSDDEKNSETIQAVLRKIGGQFIFSKLRSNPPILGEKYRSTIELVAKTITNFRSGHEVELRRLSAVELQNRFEPNGLPVSEVSKAWLRAEREKFQHAKSKLVEWHMAAFGADQFMGQTEYWSKAAFLQAEEALWLSVGLEPTEFFKAHLSPKNKERMRQGSEIEFMAKREELFRRNFNLFRLSEPLKASDILERVNRIGLEVHPRFRTILDTMIQLESPKLADEDESRIKPPMPKTDRREVDKIAQLFTAMAIDSLGFDPKALRSPVPKEIADLAADMGLNVSDDTVRKYLKLGARYIPDDWKPS